MSEGTEEQFTKVGSINQLLFLFYKYNLSKLPKSHSILVTQLEKNLNPDVLPSSHCFHGTNNANLSCKFNFHWHVKLHWTGPKAKLQDYFSQTSFTSIFFHGPNAKSLSESKRTHESCPPQFIQSYFHFSLPMKTLHENLKH